MGSENEGELEIHPKRAIKSVRRCPNIVIQDRVWSLFGYNSFLGGLGRADTCPRRAPAYVTRYSILGMLPR